MKSTKGMRSPHVGGAVDRQDPALVQAGDPVIDADTVLVAVAVAGIDRLAGAYVGDDGAHHFDPVAVGLQRLYLGPVVGHLGRVVGERDVHDDDPVTQV